MWQTSCSRANSLFFSFSSMRASSPIRASRASCEGCILWLFALCDFSSLPQRDSLLIGWVFCTNSIRSITCEVWLLTWWPSLSKKWRRHHYSWYKPLWAHHSPSIIQLTEDRQTTPQGFICPQPVSKQAQCGFITIHSNQTTSDNDRATSSIACVAGVSFFGARGVILRTCPCVFPPAHCIKTDQNKFCSVRPGRLPAQWCNHLSYKQLAFANSVCQFFYSGGWSDQGSHPCIWHKFAKNFFTSH